MSEEAGAGGYRTMLTVTHLHNRFNNISKVTYKVRLSLLLSSCWWFITARQNHRALKDEITPAMIDDIPTPMLFQVDWLTDWLSLVINGSLKKFPLKIWTPPRVFFSRSLVSVLIVGLSYGTRNVLSYTRCMMQHFLAFRDSPITLSRRSPLIGRGKWGCLCGDWDEGERNGHLIFS